MEATSSRHRKPWLGSFPARLQKPSKNTVQTSTREDGARERENKIHLGKKGRRLLLNVLPCFIYIYIYSSDFVFRFISPLCSSVSFLSISTSLERETRQTRSPSKGSKGMREIPTGQPRGIKEKPAILTLDDFPNWYRARERRGGVSFLTCDCVEEHEILKVGDFSTLPFLCHVGGSHQLARRHHRSSSVKKKHVIRLSSQV